LADLPRTVDWSGWSANSAGLSNDDWSGVIILTVWWSTQKAG